MTVPQRDNWVWVRCISPWGDYTHQTGFSVRARSPGCWAHRDDFIAGRVAWGLLDTDDPKYSLKAVYFCADGTKNAFVTTWSEVLRKAQGEQRNVLYDESEAFATCEATCEILPAGPLKDELDAFSAQYTIEQLGSVD